MKKYERKVTKIGNSYGVSLPVDLLKETGLTYGGNIQIEREEGKIILRKKEIIDLPEGVDAEFMDVLNDVIKEHDKAFKGLVDR
ncbi:AbrB/MazE/SpoVT family DNA-binding domain-containing protein [Salinicoccus sp. Marseille-QA3877]